MKYLVKLKTSWKKHNTEENAVIEAKDQQHALQIFEQKIFELDTFDSITIEPIAHIIN